jgi:hypothetical protein
MQNPVERRDFLFPLSSTEAERLRFVSLPFLLLFQAEDVIADLLNRIPERTSVRRNRCFIAAIG